MPLLHWPLPWRHVYGQERNGIIVPHPNLPQRGDPTRFLYERPPAVFTSFVILIAPRDLFGNVVSLSLYSSAFYLVRVARRSSFGWFRFCFVYWDLNSGSFAGLCCGLFILLILGSNDFWVKGQSLLAVVWEFRVSWLFWFCWCVADLVGDRLILVKDILLRSGFLVYGVTFVRSILGWVSFFSPILRERHYSTYRKFNNLCSWQVFTESFLWIFSCFANWIL